MIKNGLCYVLSLLHHIEASAAVILRLIQSHIVLGNITGFKKLISSCACFCRFIATCSLSLQILVFYSGLSWVFAFLAIGKARTTFQYLFTITSTSQGFLIFLMFTARDPVVRSFWWNLICCRRVIYNVSKLNIFSKCTTSSSTQPTDSSVVFVSKSCTSNEVSSRNVCVNLIGQQETLSTSSIDENQVQHLRQE